VFPQSRGLNTCAGVEIHFATVTCASGSSGQWGCGGRWLPLCPWVGPRAGLHCRASGSATATLSAHAGQQSAAFSQERHITSTAPKFPNWSLRHAGDPDEAFRFFSRGFPTGSVCTPPRYVITASPATALTGAGVRMGPTCALFRGQFTCVRRFSGPGGNSIPVNRKSLPIKRGDGLIMRLGPSMHCRSALCRTASLLHLPSMGLVLPSFNSLAASRWR
jgi:hypothetical protein